MYIFSYPILYRRTDIYKSFFGGFLCCTWSTDGRFIIAGSQDDLLSIYGFKGRLLVRCQGHSSWPTSVSFDEWKCTERYFRFGSAGEDSKVCLWDFSLSSLRRPKNQVSLLSSFLDQILTFVILSIFLIMVRASTEPNHTMKCPEWKARSFIIPLLKLQYL